MTKKKHKDIDVTPEIAKAVEEAVAVSGNDDAQISTDVLHKIATSSIQDNELDGIMIVGVKKGVFVPYIMAKNIPDILTLDFVLKREINKVLDNAMNPQVK